MSAASEAFLRYRETPRTKVAAFLDEVAKQMESDASSITELASAESNLPETRVQNELKRTCNQLRMFADVVADGTWVDARVDGPVRSMLVPMGPVAIFGASNFPLAFSTAGGDTASALAAKCPVVYKLHPAHPKTTARVNEAIRISVKLFGLHEGVFQVVSGGPQLSLDLVSHEKVTAVGFTGSRRVGTLLSRTAAERVSPIPVYAEMGSVNPVFIYTDALHARLKPLAKELAESFTLGVGQFCTNPGLVFVAGSDEQLAAFLKELKEAVSKVPPGKMLTAGIHGNYLSGMQQLSLAKGVKIEFSSLMSMDTVGPTVFSVSLKDFLESPQELQMELFGPSTLIVRCNDTSEFNQVAKIVEGQLTASIQVTDSDVSKSNVAQLISNISDRVGRIVFNGFPTGVEVCHAMQHGGPWPSSSDPRSTSVGSRWVRPLCWQNVPDKLLPVELQDGNPSEITRMVKGRLGEE